MWPSKVFLKSGPTMNPVSRWRKPKNCWSVSASLAEKKAKTLPPYRGVVARHAAGSKVSGEAALGNLRIGLREGLVEDAIARAFKKPLAEVSLANMLRGDIGEAAVRARAAICKMWRCVCFILEIDARHAGVGSPRISPAPCPVNSLSKTNSTAFGRRPTFRMAASRSSRGRSMRSRTGFPSYTGRWRFVYRGNTRRRDYKRARRRDPAV